jgi:hypothetical protein
MLVESEKLLERKLTAKVKSLGGWSIKLLPFIINGLPDRLILLPVGRAVFAEIKTTKKDPTKLQLVRHKKLKRLGFEVLIIDTSNRINSIE